jgi:hypothetical protein
MSADGVGGGGCFWHHLLAILPDDSSALFDVCSEAYLSDILPPRSVLFAISVSPAAAREAEGDPRSEIAEYFGRLGFVVFPAFAPGVLFPEIPNFLVLQLFLTYPLSKVQHLLMFTMSIGHIRELVYRVPMDSEAVMEGVFHRLALVLCFFPGWISSALQGQSVMILIATFAAGVVAAALAWSRPFFSLTGPLDDFIHSFATAVFFAALSFVIDGFHGISDCLDVVTMTALAVAVVYGTVVDGIIRTLQNEFVAKSGIDVLDGFRACQALYGAVIGKLIVKDAAIHSLRDLAVNVVVGGCDALRLMCALRIELPEVRLIAKNRRQYVRAHLS